MALNDLCYISATDAIAAFKAKKLSPVELMEAVIERSEKVEESVNALTYTHYDEAMNEAKLAEKNYANGEVTSPLEGLPIGIKDENDIAGRPTSGGSLILKDYVADRTSTINQRIMDAGGIVHARTATPEFCCSGVTWSRIWGVTRNPWNKDFTSGGSSGGSSARLGYDKRRSLWRRIHQHQF